MKNGKVILGVLAGLATGAFLGILFAPDKGSKTRKKIVDKGNEYVGEVGEKLNHMVENVTERLHFARKEAEDAVEEVKEKARRIKDEFAATNRKHTASN